MAHRRYHIHGVDNCNVLAMQYLAFSLDIAIGDEMLDNGTQSKIRDTNWGRP